MKVTRKENGEITITKDEEIAEFTAAFLLIAQMMDLRDLGMGIAPHSLNGISELEAIKIIKNHNKKMTPYDIEFYSIANDERVLNIFCVFVDAAKDIYPQILEHLPESYSELKYIRKNADVIYVHPDRRTFMR